MIDFVNTKLGTRLTKKSFIIHFLSRMRNVYNFNYAKFAAFVVDFFICLYFGWNIFRSAGARDIYSKMLQCCMLNGGIFWVSNAAFTEFNNWILQYVH